MRIDKSGTAWFVVAVAWCFVSPAVETPLENNGQARAAETGKAEDVRPELAFDPDRDFPAWQSELRRRLCGIMAIPTTWNDAIQPTIRRDSATDVYTMDRVEFEAEPGQVVPGYLLRPKVVKPPFPVMICLQGHSPGMHISIGRGKTKQEIASIRGGRDIAIQAVRHGWAALAIEQRAFGERAVKGVPCGDFALRELLGGRPLTGQRVFDVMRAVDFIATQPDLDTAQIGCMGNSAGGTISFYAACVDDRIRLAVVSCSFGTFESTWLYKRHCACGYLPGLLKVADMPDLAGLIAPRHLILVAGRKDGIARFDGVEQGFQMAKRAFAAAECADRVVLSAAEGGHQFYPDLAWPVIQQTLASWNTTKTQ
jgi:dienelactone hydrolase